MKVGPCHVEGCDDPSEWVIYPDRRRIETLAIQMCEPCHAGMIQAKSPGQQPYRAAVTYIRSSLG